MMKRRLAAAWLALLAMSVPAAPAAAGLRTLPDWLDPARRCPSPWGADDERGTMNLLTDARRAAAASLVRTGRSYELGRTLPVKAEIGRGLQIVTKPTAAPAGSTGRIGNEEFVAGELGQIGTNFDAFVHAGVDAGDGGSYYNCFRHQDVAGRAGFRKLGVDTVGQVFTRGVLIDVAAYKGVETLPPGYEISVADLEGALKAQGVALRTADAILINTGWGLVFDREPARFGSDSPGIGLAAGQWLAARQPVLVGSDNVAVERFVFKDIQDETKINLPVHQLFLVAKGIHVLEIVDLAALARDRAYEFLFVMQPLKLKGASGSTVVPTAIR